MNKHEHRAIQSYGKMADTYDNSAEGQFTLQFNYKLLDIIQLQDGGRLLDVACGNGRFLGLLKSQMSFEGYGSDISSHMIQTARKTLPDMMFKTAPCDALPFENKFFDVVTVCAAYHHFSNVSAFAKEAMRVLAVGGKLYIADVYYSKILRILFNPLIRFHPSGDVKFYSPDEIVRNLQNVGFQHKSTLVDGNIQIIVVKK